MKPFLPRSLSSRLIGLMLLALALSQGVSLIVYRYERAHAVRTMMREECLGRASSAVQLMNATARPERDEVLRLVNTPLARYWMSASAPQALPDWEATAKAALLHPVLGNSGVETPSLFDPEQDLCVANPGEWESHPASYWPIGMPLQLVELRKWNGYGIVVKLSDGAWLNMVYAKPAHLSNTTPAPGYYVTLLSTVIIFSFAAWLIARHIAQPLRHLTKAAERLGRGEEVAMLVEEGPDDIRKTMSTFNRMQVRLRRFVEDRTRMLAAIGHDLRTPITSLRLRAEFIRETETREKILATLAEMQAMTEASLAFASSEASAEVTRSVDLSSLLESLCDDLAELGWKVNFIGKGEKIAYLCRPDALRRALRNLIENAVRYGECARVDVKPSAENVEIIVQDDGPGISEEDRERVFAPFVRLEASRNGSTGGVGLGLAIARSIVRAHGGDIVLSAGSPGLCVRVTLPRDEEQMAGELKQRL
ncbi:sensor histidine kinase [Oleiharenicola lentus]|uniref:sensor histidine kinase n=1 Tax=Oleiharenicola lentus TaxID=2508720 RepID=UPI003F67143A